LVEALLEEVMVLTLLEKYLIFKPGTYGSDNVNGVYWYDIGDINRNVVEQEHPRDIHPRKLIDLPEFNGNLESWPVCLQTKVIPAPK